MTTPRGMETTGATKPLACRSPSWRLAALHRLDLLNPTAAAALETTPQESPTATIWLLFT